jgi:uncharacterized HhH-GPD family protein
MRVADEVVREIIEALNRADVDGMQARMHPDFEWTPLETSLVARTYRGHKEVRRYVEDWLGTFDPLRLEVQDLTEVANRVVVMVRGRARGKASGAEIETRFCQVWTVRETLALAMQEYATREQALAGLRQRSEPAQAALYDRRMPDRLFFTESDEANRLIAEDPMALLVGFALDQQVTVQKAFSGPLALKERLGSIDAATLASAELEPVFRERPAIHRFPGSMSQRVHDLAVHVRDNYDGDAARVWTDAGSSAELRANLEALPGFGEMKVKALGSVLAKRFGIEAAQELVPWHPTLGDVDSPDALGEYQAAKRLHKAEWSKARPVGAGRA